MKYIIKNKTSKTIVLLINGKTEYLYSKKSKHDELEVEELTPQILNLKTLNQVQISKKKEAN